MVGDPFLILDTSPSLWHLAQDVRVYFFQELQCKDFLVETKLDLSCILEMSLALNCHTLTKKQLTSVV